MKEGPNIAQVAALMGDPARANMLAALMSGMALTVSELATEAGVTLQTASSHLSKLNDGGLLRRQKQGRHTYYSLTGADVANVLEGLMGLAAGAGNLRVRPGPKDAAMRRARVCYNHLAGDMGVQLFDSLIRQKHLTINGKNLKLTASGKDFSIALGVDLASLNKTRTPLCRECLDWSARRAHLAGSLGRALLSQMENRRWLKRDPNSRIIIFSPAGERQFKKMFPV